MRFARLSVMAVFAAMILAAPHAQAGNPKADDAEIAALDLEAQGDLDGAIAKHREAVTLAPKNKAFKENFAATLNKAAVAKHDAKDDTTAIAYLEEALQVLPTFKAAKDNLAIIKTGSLNNDGLALLKAANYEGAAAKFKEVLDLQPGNTAAKVNLDVAEAQIAMRATPPDPATAVAKLNDAVGLDPSHQFLKDLLAQAQQAADAKAKADAEAEKNKK